MNIRRSQTPIGADEGGDPLALQAFKSRVKREAPGLYAIVKARQTLKEETGQGLTLGEYLRRKQEIDADADALLAVIEGNASKVPQSVEDARAQFAREVE